MILRHSLVTNAEVERHFLLTRKEPSSTVLQVKFGSSESCLFPVAAEKLDRMLPKNYTPKGIMGHS